MITVHLTVVMASGRTVTRVVAAAREEGLIGIVLTPAEATVLLDYAKPGIESTPGVRVAYGPLIGRWHAPQTISGRWSVGLTNNRPGAEPQLALSPDGTVLVAFDGCVTQRACNGIVGEGYAQQRVIVAWHRPGRPFGPPTIERAAPLGSVPQFDAAGSAYLSSSCSGSVAIAPAHSRRFRRTVVTSGAAKSFTLALSGAGQGLAAWVTGACAYDETTPPQRERETVLVSLLRASRFLTPVALTAAPAGAPNALVTPTGVAVSWYDGFPNGTSHVMQIDANGTPGPVQDGPTPLGADGGGDVLFGPVQPGSRDFVRPAGGGADQPAPVPCGQVCSTSSAVSPAGHTIALIWSPDLTKLDLSIWRP